MPSRALGASLFFVSSLSLGCAKSGPSPEEQRAADEQRDRELQAEIARSMAPYERAIDRFFEATSNGRFEVAYELLAPSYTNMVEKRSFVERIQKNKNFSKRVEVKILRTSAQAGTTHARCILGELGLAEIDFATSAGSPKISSIKLGGMQALPTPP